MVGTVRSIAKADKLQAMADDAGVDVELFELDVADDDSVREGFAEILAATGRVDHLVNNAGIGGNAVAEECPPELYLVGHERQPVRGGPLPASRAAADA